MPNNHRFKTTKSNSNPAQKNVAPQPNPNPADNVVPPVAQQQPSTPLNNKPPYPKEQRPVQQQQQQPQPTPDNIPPKKPVKNSKPWYKKPLFWIIGTLIVVVIAVISAMLLMQKPKPSASKPASAPKPQLTTQPFKNNKNKQPSTDLKPPKKSAPKKEVEKEEPKSEERQWKNPGSYSDMKYETDDFKIELDNSSDGVKLISDGDNQPALYISYSFTNNSKDVLQPSNIVNQNIQLKQDSQILEPDANISDNQEALDKLTASQQDVEPGKTVQVAMMYKVNNTKDQISMFFMNLKTQQQISTTQPFKL